uniref:ATP synthase F0 subunit 8 n=1 Tax=Calvisia medogensis TaxID=2042294 RepID=A0A343KJR5_9NEOP|nr:ATP synthase F0 subunit 8 [Calvisia medogensis]
MPQMMPMSWIIMYMYFLMITIIFITKIYFYKQKKTIPNKMTLLSSNEQYWKW